MREGEGEGEGVGRGKGRGGGGELSLYEIIAVYVRNYSAIQNRHLSHIEGIFKY